jgi:hypothetical protein
MTGWNLPPGMLGKELEIAGPDGEEQAERWCPTCDAERPGLVQTYGGDAWFTCDTCGSTVERGLASSTRLEDQPEHGEAWT